MEEVTLSINNLELIAKLEQLGTLPSEQDPIIDDFPLDTFDQLLQQFQLPITMEIAQRLIQLSPPSGSGCFGVEWTLLHLIENLEIPQLQSLIEQSESNEVTDLIRIRLNNYFKK